VSVVAQKSRERDGDAARRGSVASKKIVISARIRRVTIFFSYCERNHRHEPRLCMRCRWMRERNRCPLVIGPLDISARRPTARAPIPLSRWMTSNELSELQARAFLRSAWRFCRIIWPRARARVLSRSLSLSLSLSLSISDPTLCLYDIHTYAPITTRSHQKRIGITAKNGKPMTKKRAVIFAFRALPLFYSCHYRRCGSNIDSHRYQLRLLYLDNVTLDSVNLTAVYKSKYISP